MHKRTIVVILSDVTDCARLTARYIVFKVTVESLMFAVLNFKIGEITATVLRGQRALLHINVVVLFLLL